MLTELSKRQQEILDFIRERQNGGTSPSVRDIGARFGIGSPNGVMCHIKALEKKGYIERDHNRARSIRLTDQAREKDGIPLTTLEAISLSGRVV